LRRPLTRGRAAAAHRNRTYLKRRDSELGSRPRRSPARRRRLRARVAPTPQHGLCDRVQAVILACETGVAHPR